MSFSHNKIATGRGAVSEADQADDIIAAVTGKTIYLKKITIHVTLAATGGTGIVTVRDGVAGTILIQVDGDTIDNQREVDLDDGRGYPLTSGNSLSLEVSGAGTNEASAFAVAVGEIEY